MLVGVAIAIAPAAAAAAVAARNESPAQDSKGTKLLEQLLGQLADYPKPPTPCAPEFREDLNMIRADVGDARLDEGGLEPIAQQLPERWDKSGPAPRQDNGSMSG